MLHFLAGVALASGLAWVLLGAVMLTQCRKPWGRSGRRLLKVMNVTHSDLADWALRQVSIRAGDTILDVGCGGGRTIEKLAAVPGVGAVYGIDYSASSVATARTTNDRAIREGRVQIDLGTVSRLPYADRSFDLVTAIETHYYWPDLVSDLREVQRVLKPGGQVVLVAEAYEGPHSTLTSRVTMKLIRARYLTARQHVALLADAGFSEIHVNEEMQCHWLRAVATRPGASTPAGR